MLFEQKFFLDEVRNNFYISGLMKRFWAAQLVVVNDIKELCEKHNIKWFLDCGSLLGAVRHGGYVPWDDDFDICMLRDEYERFAKIAREELPDNYLVMDYHTHEYWNQVLRISNTDKIEFNKEFLAKYCDFPYPAGVDIFCLDYVSDDEAKEKERCAIAKPIMALADSDDFKEPYSEAVLEALKTIENTCGVKINLLENLNRQLYILGEKYYKQFLGTEAKRVALMNYWMNYSNHIYPVKWFENSIYMPFEGMLLPVPGGYLGKLAEDYGQYVTPSKMGGVHDYPMFEHNEKIFRNMIEGPYPFVYEISENDFVNSSREEYKANVSKIQEMYGMIVSVCNKVGELAVNGDSQHYILQLLSKVQEVAINTGSLIENVYGEGTNEVTSLELFCDKIFNCYENVKNADLFNKYFQEMENEINKSQLEFNNHVNNEKIVILTSRADQWNAIDNLYKNFISAGYDVDVVVLPYYMRDMLGEMKERVYEKEDYPLYVKVSDYETYSLKKVHPSMIITQMGHDASNYTWTIHPDYYVRNIKQYTETLVYTSPYEFDKLDLSEDKVKKCLEHLVIVPGLSHCDYTVVNNENVRAAYIDYLTEVTADKIDVDWETRITNIDDLIGIFGETGDEEAENDNDQVVSKYENLDYQAEIKSGSGRDHVMSKTVSNGCQGLIKSWNISVQDDNIQAINSRQISKRKLLVYISAANIVMYEDKIMIKLKNICNILRANSDKVSVIWYLPSYEKDLMLANGLSDLLVTSGLDVKLTDNMDECISCDAYYGDASELVLKYTELGKPVMIMNVDV